LLLFNFGIDPFMYFYSPSKERNLLWLLALIQFTLIMDFMVMMPLGPQIIQSLQVSPAAFATAVSVYSWCSGLSGLLGATYIDRFDRRKLLLLIFAFFAISNLACAWAVTYPMLLLARAFAGVTGGVLSSIIMAIVADVIPVERRGWATGTLMTAFSLAAVAGVPAGVLIGAHLGWSAPFLLLVLLSVLILGVAFSIVPPLTAHLQKVNPSLQQVLRNLAALFSDRMHLEAFLLTFVMMVAHMLVIPFISPVLVSNYGISPANLGWMYMAGGAATFFTARPVGRLADQLGKHRIFRVFALLSFIPILFITHMPDIPFVAILFLFPCFMVLVSSRIIPLQALITTLPRPAQRGAFLSANSAIQAFGTGCGAWVGGMLLSQGPDGHLQGYGNIGWLAVGLASICVLWIGKIRGHEDLERA
jgi:MFS family permease